MQKTQCLFCQEMTVILWFQTTCSKITQLCNSFTPTGFPHKHTQRWKTGQPWAMVQKTLSVVPPHPLNAAPWLHPSLNLLLSLCSLAPQDPTNSQRHRPLDILKCVCGGCICMCIPCRLFFKEKWSFTRLHSLGLMRKKATKLEADADK